MTSCPCYRFMVHPLKAATSYDCDGCGHHASFHRMESKEDEEVAKRWKEQQELEARSRAKREIELRTQQRLLTASEDCQSSVVEVYEGEEEEVTLPKRQKVGTKTRALVEIENANPGKAKAQRVQKRGR